MELKRFLGALRRSWWLILLLAILAGGAGYGYSKQQTPQYASEVTFFATTPTSTPGGSAFAGDQFAQQRVASYVELLSSDRLARMVLTAQPIPGETVDELRRQISGSARQDTVLLTATVIDSDPARSGQIAAAVAGQLPRLVEQIESDGGTKTPLVSLDVVNGPTTLASPVSPKTIRNTGLAVIVGLFLGVLAAMARELLDRSVHGSDHIRQLTGRPVLSAIPRIATGRRGRRRHQVGIVNNDARAQEAFRQLRTNLQFVDPDNPVTAVVVTSASAGEGKTATAVNLARTFAGAERKVLLVDADLRRPAVAQRLDVEGGIGLANVLAGQVDLDDAVQRLPGLKMDVLPSGTIPPNPSELLGGSSMRRLLDRLRHEYDMVVIDAPPALPVTDPAVLSVIADATIVVTSAGKTRRLDLTRALENLEAVDARILGFVLNRAKTRGTHAERRYGYPSQPQATESGVPASKELPGRRTDSAVPAPTTAAEHQRTPPATRSTVEASPTGLAEVPPSDTQPAPQAGARSGSHSAG